MGGDGRDDDESVSRGGTPAPLSDGSGATPGGGAAGGGASEASEASERAGASGASDETTGDDGGDFRARVHRRGGKKTRQSRDVRRAEAAKAGRDR